MGERDGAGGSKVEGGRWRGEVKGKRYWREVLEGGRWREGGGGREGRKEEGRE